MEFLARRSTEGQAGALTQDVDLIYAMHNAANLLARRPSQSSEFIAPADNKVVANLKVCNRESVDRLSAHCIVAEISLQIKFRDGI
jgi:hypothetical protein